MTASKSLPARPSLESLRKQAKQLARGVAAADTDSIARVRAHLPRVELPLTQRNAQLVIAREYGFAGWQDLTREVGTRLGKGLEWAVTQAQRVIHDNDVERLKELLAEHPSLLSWKGDDHDGSLLGMATGAFGDAGDAQREQWFTRGACAELLIDAGAVVVPDVAEGLLQSRAKGLLDLFERKGLLPRTLPFRAALGDRDGTRAALSGDRDDQKILDRAFVAACHFGHEAVAAFLLDRSIARDPALGGSIDGRTDRVSFIRAFAKAEFAQVAEFGLWRVFVMEQISQTLQDDDLRAFTSGLQREPWLLGDAHVAFQVGLIETASLQEDRGAFVGALLDLAPALLRRQPPPAARAIEWAFTYGNTHLLPLLTRIWPVPDNLAYAAGLGDLARVRSWFDGAGSVHSLDSQYPYNDPVARGHLRWDPPTAQHVLDVALAFAVVNRHFDVSDFLLERGANINSNWNSHEPASILHHLVFLPNSRPSMTYLVEHGIDLTIRDYRWDSTAAGWARHALRDDTSTPYSSSALVTTDIQTSPTGTACSRLSTSGCDRFMM